MNESRRVDRAKLLAAAHAAASWGRARRAAWADDPLRDAGTAVGVIDEDDVFSHEEALAIAIAAPPPVAAVPKESGPSIATRAMTSMRPLGASLVRWVPRVAAAAIVAALAGASGLAVLNWIRSRPEQRPEPVAARAAPAKPAAAAAPTTPATGELQVTSTPEGAQVLVDGQARGVTPLTLTDVAPGRHSVELRSPDGTVHRTVTVVANKSAIVDESIFAGWLVVYSPFDVTVSEGSRMLRADDRGQIMLPPGRHEIRLGNRLLGYEEVRQVELKPGAMMTLSVTPPRSMITVTANEPAEVWVDGTRVGDTPLTALPIDLGTHEILVKRQAGGERRVTATVTVRPYALDVDFTKPQR